MSAPPQNILTGSPQPRQALTSSSRAGDFLLVPLSSDSVHDFSSSSSGSTEEFCEPDLQGFRGGGGFRNQRPPPWGPLPGAVLGVGTHLETLFFSLSPGGAQSDRRSRGERARRGGRRPSLP